MGPKDLFFFGDHLISAGKTVRISVKTFLKRHFLRLFWSSHNRKSVIFEQSPGPRSSLSVPEHDWGARNEFWGAREVYLGEFESVDQTKKVKTKKKVFSSKIFTNSGFHLKILAIFRES